MRKQSLGDVRWVERTVLGSPTLLQFPLSRQPLVSGCGPGLHWPSSVHWSFFHLEAFLRVQQQTCQAHTSAWHSMSPAGQPNAASLPF